MKENEREKRERTHAAESNVLCGTYEDGGVAGIGESVWSSFHLLSAKEDKRIGG